MKRKFSSMGRVAIALVLALSLVLVMAAPVAALTEPTVTVAPTVVGQTAAYTIVFTTIEDLAFTAGDDIRIEFPDGTTVPAKGDYDPGDITINTIDADDIESVVGRKVTINVPEDVENGTVTVVFKLTAAIKNPLAIDAYTLDVSTSREVTPVPSAPYDITAPEGPVDLYRKGDEPLEYFASYDTIDEAIGDADDGDTIRVHSNANGYDSSLETYPIDINEVNVIVESYEGADTTTIDASGSDAEAAVAITASGVTLGGEGAGFTIIAEDYASANAFFNPTGVHLKGGGSGLTDVTIAGNVITGGDLSPQLGIQIGTYDVTETYSGIQILKNDLDTTWDVSYSGGDATNPTCGAIKSWPTTTLDEYPNEDSIGLLIDDNVITRFSVGINLCGPVAGESDTKPAIISNNTISDSDFNGIEVGGATITDLKICGNHIYDNGGNGVAISGGDADNVKVEQNDIYNNGNGVKVYDGVTSVDSIFVNYNDIYNNTNTTVADRTDLPTAWTWAVYHNYGVFNDAATSNLDAKYNFWSDPSATPLDISGPDSATYAADEVDNFWAGIALGTGDIAGAVAGSTVLYDPWLTEPQATVIDSGKRSYGSDALLLEKGWNTLSVPCGLKGSADTFDEIELLGDFLTAANSDIGYSYDALANDWVLIDASTELEPGKGFYILMKAASRFPVLYFDGFLDLPAYDMYEGWNLIGSAFGIDKTVDDDNDGTTDVGDYGVASVDVDTDVDPTEAATKEDAESYMDKDAALDSISVGASVVVSPSVPGQLIAWAEVTGAGANVMLVGEAYWVFMTANGTLAGFEVAPFCFEPGVIPTP